MDRTKKEQLESVWQHTRRANYICFPRMRYKATASDPAILRDTAQIDLGEIRAAIDQLEDEIKGLEGRLGGEKPHRAARVVVPREW